MSSELPVPSVRCPACDAPAPSCGKEVPDHEYGLSRTARYAGCPACGTLFQQPMPGEAELAGFYPADYHSMTHAGRLQRLRDGLRVRRLARLVPDGGALLDFGCGDGSFLVAAAASLPGRALWGFEIAERSEIQSLAGGAVTVVRGAFAELLERLPPCGLITMNHVIEHLPDPLLTVSRLAERLVPGGVLEGQTPAADSLERAVFGTRWSGFHAPRHTVVFSRDGLARLLERSGLPSAEVRGAFNPAGIAVSLGSLPHAGPGRIRRGGLKWVCLLGAAGLLAPVDLLSGRPGIVDFMAVKRRG